jgi:cytosine/adenosine deaminase-related metal-dependent hydrolase
MRTAGLRALRASPLVGVSYVELFGIGLTEEAGIAFARGLFDGALGLDEGGVALGLSPHAPYSCSARTYGVCAALARQHGVRLMTHAGETPEERDFITHGRGAFIGLLERVGAWDASVLKGVGKGLSPVEHVVGALSKGVSAAMAHVNDCSDRDIELLASSGASVTYCPRASAYFGQDEAFGAHRYREMLDAGINVALGTDSIINLPGDQVDQLSTLHDARLLAARDGVDPTTLLAMCTTRGARALGLDEELFRFPPVGGSAPIGGIGAVSVDISRGASPAALVMQSREMPELLVGAGRSS